MTDLAVADPSAELEAKDWTVWLAAILPAYCTARFAPHHAALWDWATNIEAGVRPETFVGIWPRGGAKSTSAEAATVRVAARRSRRYGLYVCDTQDRADDHVANVASMLESDRVALFYPDLASRRVGKFGNSKGWRRNRLWTASGFVLDAIGLDTAARGVKLEDQRPDWMVLDDIDGTHDTPQTTARKIGTITKALIPAGADDLAVLAIQNLVIPDGVFAQLADGRAQFLRRRIVSGPIPAVEGLVLDRADDGRDIIAAGSPTWEGQGLARCQEFLDDWGTQAFLEEAQHEVDDAEGALWSAEQINAGRVDLHPDLDLVVVSVDPSGGGGKGHDEQGIVAVGRGAVDRCGYVLEDDSCSLSAAGWGRRAVLCAIDTGAAWIVVEDNYGGDSMTNTVQQAADALVREGVEAAAPFGSQSRGVRSVNAKDSKRDRAAPVSVLYGEKERPDTWGHARVRHVGTFPTLEREMQTWDPAVTSRSPNRIDALVHGVAELGIEGRRHGRRRGVVATGVAA